MHSITPEEVEKAKTDAGLCYNASPHTINYFMHCLINLHLVGFTAFGLCALHQILLGRNLTQTIPNMGKVWQMQQRCPTMSTS